MARPKIQITEKQVETLAKLGATEIEIAEVFACHASTISKRFSQNYASGRGQMKLRLRRLQWKSAAKGSVPMQIHLGKHLLGQSDQSLRMVSYTREEVEKFTDEQLEKAMDGKDPYR